MPDTHSKLLSNQIKPLFQPNVVGTKLTGNADSYSLRAAGWQSLELKKRNALGVLCHLILTVPVKFHLIGDVESGWSQGLWNTKKKKVAQWEYTEKPL
jgi:hypothetical protein